MIDGAPTLELDYSSLHPNLLYHYAGVEPPGSDLYELDGYPKEYRKFFKAVFLRMINSASRNDAKGSIREAAFAKGKLKIPAELGKLEDKYLDPVIDKLLEKHKPLADKSIFKDKDLGNKLQNIDSKLAEKVLLHFALDGIPVLPLHDSFRIDARLYDKLQEIMHRVIITNFGRPIRISNDDYVPLLGRLIGMAEEKIKSGDIHDEEELESLIHELETSDIFAKVGQKLRRLKNESMAN